MEYIKAIQNLLCNGEITEAYKFNDPECEKRLKDAHAQLGKDAEEILNVLAGDFELQGFGKGFKFAVQLMAECMPKKSES